jgi:hypothetical protein
LKIIIRTGKRFNMFYGNYRGTVKSHGKNGKCQVFVPSVYNTEFETRFEKLPWAEPAQPLFASGRDGNGVFQYPKLETTVWVFFDGGDINRPVMFASTLGASDNFDKYKYILKTDKVTIELNEVSGEVEITIDGNAKVELKTLEIDGDVLIKGTLDVSKTIDADGVITSKLDCKSGLVSGLSHPHIGNQQKPTSPPIPTL